jgi:hypothetical protein
MIRPKSAAGLLLVAVPLVFTAGFTGLQLSFDYPDILRRPAAEVLARFAEGGGLLLGYWYAMMLAAILLVPTAVALAMHLWRRDPLLAALSAAFGVLAGLVQALGLLRWVILVPSLAAQNGLGGVEAEAAGHLFDAANRYLGMGVGEHFGYLFTAVWTALVAALVWTPNRLVALAGLAIALGVAAGMLEPFGVPFTATINAVAYSLWALWALMLGIVVLRSERSAPGAMPIAV